MAKKRTGRPPTDQTYLIGKKFGKLTIKNVYRIVGSNGHKYIACDCTCECGNEKKGIRKWYIINNDTASCGCVRKEMQHNQSRTRLYRIYRGMKTRCYTKTCSLYPKYGGKGITICDEWLGESGFKEFYKWATEHGYTDELSIDRIDAAKGYSPENCRWATWEEQNTHLAMPKTNKSGVLGVSWSKKEQKWISAISIYNKPHRIGCYNTIEEAATARNQFIERNGLPHVKSNLPEERFRQHSSQLSLFN